jgi:hypothetical protein
MRPVAVVRDASVVLDSRKPPLGAAERPALLRKSAVRVLILGGRNFVMLKHFSCNRRLGLACLGFVLTAMLWKWSMSRSDSAMLFHFKTANVSVGSLRGHLWAELAEPVAVSEIGLPWERFEDRRVYPYDDDWLLRKDGFDMGGRGFCGGGVCILRGPLQIVGGQVMVRATFVALPLYLVEAALGFVVLHAFLSRRSHDWSRGHCVACGYDLRATPDCCPECGTVAGTLGHIARSSG